MQITQTDIILAAQLVFPIACSVAVALCRLLLEKLPAVQQEKVRQFCHDAVHAVEQTMNAVPGPEKKAEAVNIVNALLKAAGISASKDTINTLIESAVYAMNQAVRHDPAQKAS